MRGPRDRLRRSASAAAERCREVGWLWSFALVRHAVLGAYLLVGRVARVKRRGWWPVIPPLAVVLTAATVLWVLAPTLGADSEVRNHITPTNLLLLFLLVLLLLGINHARRRVVVESFVDYTAEEGKAVSGLATLLVTELGRLRELYQQVNELAVPTAVGVERSGGFDREKEAASFLTVSAEEATSVLEGVVASDASLAAGPVKIPLGPLIALVNRLTRGPRVVGTVHLTEAGGGPTLTAQLVGGPPSGTWRVDEAKEPESAEERKAFLDRMVRELACRMFAQLILGGATRWKAVWAFNEYLQLYGDSRRTPRDRARFLKQAQSRLMSAVAEDESFDLAYYNLGVIYTQLAQTELTAERLSQDGTSRADLDREKLNKAREEAARVAFSRAAERNAELWEAYFALAVTRFSEVKAQVDITDPAPQDLPDRDRGKALVARLREVIRYCDHAYEVARRHGASTAAALDLKGMAQTRLAEDLHGALRTHRRAVGGFWWEYCRARRRATARRAREDHGVRAARTNAVAALSNLALAYERCARKGETDRRAKLSLDRRRDLRVAIRVFRWAIRLSRQGSGQSAACRFERGVILDRLQRHLEAACEYERAQQIHPRNCEYAARRAVSLAWHARAHERTRVAAEAAKEADHALRLLAGPFSVATAPWAPPATEKRVDATLDALAEMAEPDSDRAERIQGIKDMKQALTACARVRDDIQAVAHQCRELGRLRRRVRAARGANRWELPQIELAKARLLARNREWVRAERVLRALVCRLRDADSTDLVEFGLYAEHARALRELGRHRDALITAAECVRRDPLSVDGRREAGRAHFALRQYTDALASWSQALWLSPSDPYLHYEVAMCHRQLAGERLDAPRYDREMAQAKTHFAQAQELFDGEDLHGEAWMRVWLGRTALDRGHVDEAVRYLAGAEHGSARAAAALLLGEAYLARDQRVAAEHAFVRCQGALRPGSIATLRGRDTIDAGWGDELPRPAVLARLRKGLAEAKYTTAASEQDPADLESGLEELEAARAKLRQIRNEVVRDGLEADLLETFARFLIDAGRADEALIAARKRLRFEVSPEALRLERKVRAAARASALDERRRRWRWWQ